MYYESLPGSKSHQLRVGTGKRRRGHCQCPSVDPAPDRSAAGTTARAGHDAKALTYGYNAGVLIKEGAASPTGRHG
jgi:hypothetical protein